MARNQSPSPSTNKVEEQERILRVVQVGSKLLIWILDFGPARCVCLFSEAMALAKLAESYMRLCGSKTLEGLYNVQQSA